MARNTLKCTLTGVERITNNSYLKKRLNKLGIEEEEFRKYYISKVCIQNLAIVVGESGLAKAAQSLSGTEVAYSAEDVHKMLLYNGKNRLVLAQALKPFESNMLDVNENSAGGGAHADVDIKTGALSAPGFVPLTTYTATTYIGEGTAPE